MDKHLRSDPFESVRDEISSLNFGVQEDISIKKSEVEFYGLMSQICEEYNLGHTIQHPIFLGTDIYTSFTSLFSKTFDLDEETYGKLYFINRSLYIYTIYMDSIFDEQEAPRIDVWFLVSLLRDQANALLTDLFSKNSDFWTYARKYQRRVIASTLEERLKWNEPKPYSLDEAFNIASGKASIAQMMTTALACLSNSTELIHPLEKSLDAFFSGLQFRDDLRDWRVDFVAGRYSYLLSQIIERKDLHGKLESVTLEELARMVYFTGLAEEILGEAINFYNQALSYIDHAQFSDWKDAVDNSISETSVLLRQLKEVKEREIGRVSKLIVKKESGGL